MSLANFPVQELLFYISDGAPSDHSASAMESLVSVLGGSRTWTLGPPEFVDAAEPAEARSGDEALRTVGGILSIYSARSPEAERLPHEIDKANYEDVLAVIDALSAFSAATGREIAVELAGTQVGWIQHGSPDRSLAEGLLAEWRKALDMQQNAGGG